jgi:hypothetical protein
MRYISIAANSNVKKRKNEDGGEMMVAAIALKRYRISTVADIKKFGKFNLRGLVFESNRRKHSRTQG